VFVTRTASITYPPFCASAMNSESRIGSTSEPEDHIASLGGHTGKSDHGMIDAFSRR
jgi:hypothetical protein